MNKRAQAIIALKEAIEEINPDLIQELNPYPNLWNPANAIMGAIKFWTIKHGLTEPIDWEEAYSDERQ